MKNLGMICLLFLAATTQAEKLDLDLSGPLENHLLELDIANKTINWVEGGALRYDGSYQFISREFVSNDSNVKQDYDVFFQTPQPWAYSVNAISQFWVKVNIDGELRSIDFYSSYETQQAAGEPNYTGVAGEGIAINTAEWSFYADQYEPVWNSLVNGVYRVSAASFPERWSSPSYGEYSPGSETWTGDGSFIVTIINGVQNCQRGTYAANNSCVDAPPGYYVAFDNETEATACSPGYFAPNAGSGECFPAPTGTYVPESGAITTIDCPPGTYNAQLAQTSCTDVPAGHFTHFLGSIWPSQCTAGTYQPLAGQAFCLQAPTNSYAPLNGMVDVLACPENSFSGIGQTYCEPSPPAVTQCPSGYYLSQSDKVCIAAEAGHYALGGTATQQLPCLPGHYQPQSGQSQCLNAAAGYYTDQTGQSLATASPSGHFTDASSMQRPIACAPGTYQPDAGKTACLLAPPGSFVAGTGAIAATLCAAGSYQDEYGAQTCKPSPANHFVASAGSVTYTVCADDEVSSLSSVSCSASITSAHCTPGYYFDGDAGQCLAAPAGSYVAESGAVIALLCPVGTFTSQPGSAACVLANPGTFVSSTGATGALLCAAGTVQPNSAASDCVDAPAGTFAPVTGMAEAFDCPPGSFSATAGAIACTLSPENFYVEAAGSQSALACPAGTTSPIGASECSTDLAGSCMPGTYLHEGSCVTTPAGSFTHLPDSPQPVLCAPGFYQPSVGQTGCLPTRPGYFTHSAGSTTELICPAGTYQPYAESVSCLQAPANHYIANPGATNFEACPDGSFSHPGASECTADALPEICPAGSFWNNTELTCELSPKGRFVASAGATFATACTPGYYADALGSLSCKPSQPGHYVATSEASQMTLCEPGTYQDSSAQTECIASPAGHETPLHGMSTPLPCRLGFFQNETGATSCTLAPENTYVDSLGATEATACPSGQTSLPGAHECVAQIPDYCLAGTYLDNELCVPAPAGHFIPFDQAIAPFKCPIGSYQPATGQTECVDASPGHYVATLGSATQTACAAGSFSSTHGQWMCALAPANHYVPAAGATSFFACAENEFSEPGALACIESDTIAVCPASTLRVSDSECQLTAPGYYTDTPNASVQLACPAGTFAPFSGQSSCFDAQPGHFVAQTGASEQTPCPTGEYQPLTGQTSCLPAPAAHFVPSIGSSSFLSCPTGTQATSGQRLCTTIESVDVTVRLPANTTLTEGYGEQLFLILDIRNASIDLQFSTIEIEMTGLAELQQHLDGIRLYRDRNNNASADDNELESNVDLIPEGDNIWFSVQNPIDLSTGDHTLLLTLQW